ncbi:MAG: AAA family ATPase [Bacteroidales bacterium]
MKKTLIVNLFGGPGTGKSSMASTVFSILKWKGVTCEYVSEYAKELVWSERNKTFEDELYIFAKQHHRIKNCVGKVDVIITDRPLFMSIPYNRIYGSNKNTSVSWDSYYEKLVFETVSMYDNYNIYLTRKKDFNEVGRQESVQTAMVIDDACKESLQEFEMNYITLDGVQSTGEQIATIILNLIQ